MELLIYYHMAEYMWYWGVFVLGFLTLCMIYYELIYFLVMDFWLCEIGVWIVALEIEVYIWIFGMF